MYKMRLAVSSLVLLTTFACTPKPELQTEQPSNSTKIPSVLPSRVVPTPTETRLPTSTPTLITPTEVPLDPCSLISQDTVDSLLGEPSQITQEMFTCLYLAQSGSLSIALGIWSVEEFRMDTLNTIAQLRDGCSLRVEYTSEEPTSTPFPPEIQELADLSLLEMMGVLEKAYHDCEWDLEEGAYQRIDGLGDVAYFTMLDLGWWRLGTLTVLLDEIPLSFSMTTNQELERERALEATLILAQEVLEGLN